MIQLKSTREIELMADGGKILAATVAMQSLRELISRVRSWAGWRFFRRSPAVPTAGSLPFLVTMERPILREVTPHGVRVYSLCGRCGAQLAASATLCESCAQRRSSRSAPNA